MGKGIFGDLFDFNHDGELDTFERVMEFEAFEEMTKDDEEDDPPAFDSGRHGSAAAAKPVDTAVLPCENRSRKGCSNTV